ncbi:MAG: ThuA domain-containing protein, partial [Planctomycetota bacterium]
AQARLLHDCLLRGPLGNELQITRAEDDTWPTADVIQADCLVVIGDGRDGDMPYAEASHLANPERIADVEKLTARGAGLVAIHFSTFAPERELPCVLAWQGAAFQWEQNGKRDWHSRITWASGLPDLVATEHQTLRGVVMTPLREEYYHRLAVHPQAVPLVAVRALPGTPHEQNVAWALERSDGGRGFSTTMGHSLDSLRHNGLRTLLLNGIAWAAGCTVPATGLGVPFAEREDVNHRLGLGSTPAPIRVAVLAGNAAHRWHNWPESTAALLRAWGDDPRITARVHTDPNDLATSLSDRDVLVLNWVNWQDPTGMPEAARAAIQTFVARGGGVFIHHFANGACHASLTDAAASDWPWYRTLVRRIWEHRPIAPGPSSHDRFRSFEVKPCSDHPLIANMTAFTVEDELYYRQHGSEPISALMTARSEDTGTDEPLVWAYEVGAGRVVQSLLGHSAKTYEPAQMRAFARRVIAWCARRAIHGAANGI